MKKIICQSLSYTKFLFEKLRMTKDNKIFYPVFIKSSLLSSDASIKNISASGNSFSAIGLFKSMRVVSDERKDITGFNKGTHQL